MLAQVTQAAARVHAVSYQFLGAPRCDNLAAVGGRENSSASVESRAVVVIATLMGDAGMDRHPYPYLAHNGPLGICQAALGGDRRSYGVEWIGERGAIGITRR
jgi:hypothetical protein